MISNTISMGEQKMSKAIVNSMIQALSESLKSDQTLAKDLLRFLNEREINIPSLNKPEINKILPVSFNKKKSGNQMDKLKNSFDENDLNENIL